MRKLFKLRIEVLTGILAAVAFVGILAVSGAPSLGVAEGATQFKAGLKSLSAAVVGQEPIEITRAKDCDSRRNMAHKNRLSRLSSNCDGDKKGCDKDKTAALGPKCDGDKKGCDKEKTAALSPKCDGDKKDCEKKAASGLCPFSGTQAVHALNTTGGCPKSKPAETESVVKDSAPAKLAMAE